MFQHKVIVITGGAGGIGKCIAEEFKKMCYNQITKRSERCDSEHASCR